MPEKIITPRQKAISLVRKFYRFCNEENGNILAVLADADMDSAKQCALICVDQIIMEAKGYRYEYYKKVKSEIKKL